MKKSLALVGAAVLHLGACSSSTEEATVASATGSNIEDASPTNTDQGFVKKDIGEDAGAGCSDLGSMDCDVLFRVTEIQRGYDCTDPYFDAASQGVAEGDELLYVSIDAEMAPVFESEFSDNVLHSQHLGVMDQEGYYIQSPQTVFCNGLKSDLHQLHPGTKARGEYLIAVPAGSETFRIGMLVGNGGWEWDIP